MARRHRHQGPSRGRPASGRASRTVWAPNTDAPARRKASMISSAMSGSSSRTRMERPSRAAVSTRSPLHCVAESLAAFPAVIRPGLPVHNPKSAAGRGKSKTWLKPYPMPLRFALMSDCQARRAGTALTWRCRSGSEVPSFRTNAVVVSGFKRTDRRLGGAHAQPVRRARALIRCHARREVEN